MNFEEFYNKFFEMLFKSLTNESEMQTNQTCIKIDINSRKLKKYISIVLDFLNKVPKRYLKNPIVPKRPSVPKV